MYIHIYTNIVMNNVVINLFLCTRYINVSINTGFARVFFLYLYYVPKYYIHITLLLSKASKPVLTIR